jgi:hypothetical protein
MICSAWVQEDTIFRSEQGRLVVISMPAGGFSLPFEWAAELHEQLGLALVRFLDPTPLPEAEPPPPLPERSAAKPRASLEELA